MSPVNPWLSRALLFLGGYFLRWWIAGIGPESSDNESHAARPRQARKQSSIRPPPPQEELKLVLVVNDSLKMGKGKIGKLLIGKQVHQYNGRQTL